MREKAKEKKKKCNTGSVCLLLTNSNEQVRLIHILFVRATKKNAKKYSSKILSIKESKYTPEPQ